LFSFVSLYSVFQRDLFQFGHLSGVSAASGRQLNIIIIIINIFFFFFFFIGFFVCIDIVVDDIARKHNVVDDTSHE